MERKESFKKKFTEFESRLAELEDMLTEIREEAEELEEASAQVLEATEELKQMEEKCDDLVETISDFLLSEDCEKFGIVGVYVRRDDLSDGETVKIHSEFITDGGCDDDCDCDCGCNCKPDTLDNKERLQNILDTLTDTLRNLCKEGTNGEGKHSK